MENRRFRNGLWLVNTLLNYKKLNREELNQLWQRNTDLSGGAELSRMQLLRAIRFVLDVLGVVIECDEKDSYRYYIAGNESLKATEWLVSSFSVNQLMSSQSDVRQRILLEDIPSGQYFLPTIIEAMSKGKAMELVYQKFVDSEAYTCLAEPYCVKLYQQRWYLLACKDHRPFLQVFALDRIQQLHILEQVDFHLPESFSPSDYFTFYLGVFTGGGTVVEDVVLKVNAFWRDYLRTLPLHATQQETETHHDYSLFRYRLVVTPDLVNQLLSYGTNVEVLAPQSLRDQMRQATAGMAALYE